RRPRNLPSFPARRSSDLRHALRHVTEADFRRVAEEVSGRELGWFFEQWFHSTAWLDYGIGEARVERLADGRWRTEVEVLRLGEADRKSTRLNSSHVKISY